MKTAKLFLVACLFGMTAFLSGAQAAGPVTKLIWHGHAAFEIVTPKGHVLFIDPWLSNPLNPDASDGKNPLAKITRADYILLTHAHSDHVGETVELAKKTGAKLVTNFELGNNLVAALGFPEKQAGMDTLFNIGGVITIAGGEVTVAMVPAVHSSGLSVGEGKPEIYGGNPAGFVVKIQHGPVIYDSGDTAYFRDMEEIGSSFHPDVALINIGGHFGMEPMDAARAAKAVKAGLVIPQHFKTFPILTQSAGPFFKQLDKFHIAHLEMKPGQTIEFEGAKLKN